MKVMIEPAVLENDAHWSLVDSLIRMFESGRHRWAGNDDRIKESSWYKNLSQARKKKAGDLLRDIQPWRSTPKRSNGPHTRQVMVVDGPTPVNQAFAWMSVGVEDALTALSGMYVLLENAKHDAGFLSWMIRHANSRHLDDDLRTGLLDDLVQSRVVGKVVRVQNGGGSGTGDELARLYGVLAPIFVLLDSDRMGPSEPEGRTATRVRTTHRERGSAERVGINVLERREAENYIPEGFLRAFASRCSKEAVVNALLDPSVGKRACWYDMEKGLNEWAKRESPPDPAGWHELSHPLREDLGPGFGPSIKAEVGRLASCDEAPDLAARAELDKIAQSLFDML